MLLWIHNIEHQLALSEKNVTPINLEQFYLRSSRDPIHAYEILMVTEIIQCRTHNELGLCCWISGH